MKCKNCGFEVNPGDQICMNCGAKLSVENTVLPEVEKIPKPTKNCKNNIPTIILITIVILIIIIAVFLIIKYWVLER